MLTDLLALSWLWLLLLAVVAYEQIGWRVLLWQLARKELLEGLEDALATLREAKEIAEQISSPHAPRLQDRSERPTIH